MRTRFGLLTNFLFFCQCKQIHWTAIRRTILSFLYNSWIEIEHRFMHHLSLRPINHQARDFPKTNSLLEAEYLSNLKSYSTDEICSIIVSSILFQYCSLAVWILASSMRLVANDFSRSRQSCDCRIWHDRRRGLSSLSEDAFSTSSLASMISIRNVLFTMD
jgi:hypothetical protein